MTDSTANSPHPWNDAPRLRMIEMEELRNLIRIGTPIGTNHERDSCCKQAITLIDPLLSVILGFRLTFFLIFFQI